MQSQLRSSFDFKDLKNQNVAAPIAVMNLYLIKIATHEHTVAFLIYYLSVTNALPVLSTTSLAELLCKKGAASNKPLMSTQVANSN